MSLQKLQCFTQVEDNRHADGKAMALPVGFCVFDEPRLARLDTIKQAATIRFALWDAELHGWCRTPCDLVFRISTRETGNEGEFQP